MAWSTCDRNDGDKHTLHGGLEGLDVKRWTLKNLSEATWNWRVGRFRAKAVPKLLDFSRLSVRIIGRENSREKEKVYIGSTVMRIVRGKVCVVDASLKRQRTPRRRFVWRTRISISADCDSNRRPSLGIPERIKKYLVLDDENIPTGEIRECHEAFDFSEKRLVFATLPPMCTPLGFDHNFCIDGDNFSRSVNIKPQITLCGGRCSIFISTNTPTTRFDESLTHCASFESTSTDEPWTCIPTPRAFNFTGSFSMVRREVKIIS